MNNGTIACTPKEAARLLGVSKPVIYGLIETGRLTATRVSASGKRGRWIIQRASLEELFNQQNSAVAQGA